MIDTFYIRRCFELAIQGAGMVSPNPMVGCVIVLKDKIIGEGFHERYGGPHAEVNAVRNMLETFGKDGEGFLGESTVYVNLEPCAHFGKTPPCADLLIKYAVKKVVVCNIDPFPEVAGKGLEKLRSAGIIVETGALYQEGQFLNRRFFTRIQKQRPYIILKWAETRNGYFAPADRTRHWITGPEARIFVHKWRSEEDAILVGKNTSLSDDPELTVRHWEGKSPVRVLIDRNLETPGTAKIFNDASETIVFNANKSGKDGNITFLQLEDMEYYLPEKIIYQLYLLDIQSVIVEGGANILNQFLKNELWDEARVFSGAASLENGLPAPVIGREADETFTVGKDNLNIYYK